jgi:hypothetical protein
MWNTITSGSMCERNWSEYLMSLPRIIVRIHAPSLWARHYSRNTASSSKVGEETIRQLHIKSLKGVWILYCVSISEHDVSRASLESSGHFARDFGVSTNNQSHTPTIYKQHTSNFILCLMMAITAKYTKWRFLLYNGNQSTSIKRPNRSRLSSVCGPAGPFLSQSTSVNHHSCELTINSKCRDVYNLTTLK